MIHRKTGTEVQVQKIRELKMNLKFLVLKGAAGAHPLINKLEIFSAISSKCLTWKHLSMHDVAMHKKVAKFDF